MKTHYLKTKNPYYNDIINNNKNFELRKDDRDFQVGDTLVLQEYDNKLTGNQIIKTVVYKLKGGIFGLDKSYCILGLK